MGAVSAWDRGRSLPSMRHLLSAFLRDEGGGERRIHRPYPEQLEKKRKGGGDRSTSGFQPGERSEDGFFSFSRKGEKKGGRDRSMSRRTGHGKEGRSPFERGVDLAYFLPRTGGREKGRQTAFRSTDSKERRSATGEEEQVVVRRGRKKRRPRR